MMIFSWLKRRRRERILAQPFPDEWLAYVQENVAQYRLLAPTEQEKLRRRVQVFVAEKKWVGCGGLELNDEMKVTIAAQACLLVLGIQYEYHYDQILSLIRASREGRATLLDQYGASSRAEFFAVATECFFERPLALEKQHPELYAILRDFYRQDPAHWPWPSARPREEKPDSARETESPTTAFTIACRRRRNV